MFRSAMLLRSCTACFCFYVMSAGMAPLAADAQKAAAPDTQSPLEPLPGLGVAWPDLDKPDAVAPLEPDEEESKTAIEETGGDAVEIGRAQVCTTVHNAHIVCPLMLE